MTLGGVSLPLETVLECYRQGWWRDRTVTDHFLRISFWPERLEIMVDMPRTPSGKIQKFKMRGFLGGSAGSVAGMKRVRS